MMNANYASLRVCKDGVYYEIRGAAVRSPYVDGWGKLHGEWGIKVRKGSYCKRKTDGEEAECKDILVPGVVVVLGEGQYARRFAVDSITLHHAGARTPDYYTVKMTEKGER